MTDLPSPAFDVVILDCDGVILDSNRLKIDAFRQTLEAHGFDQATVVAGSAWQSVSFGTSRYRLFETMLSGRFGEPPPVSLDALLATYGSSCAAGYLEVPETPRLRAALEMLAEQAALFVVSGSDEAELRQVLHKRRLSPFFRQIYGSPATKVQNIARVREAYESATGRPPARVLFVGDAVADLEAADATGCEFVFMEPYSTVREEMLTRVAERGLSVVSDLGSLADRWLLSKTGD